MSEDEVRQAFALFKEKAEKLRQSSFVSKAMKDSGVTPDLLTYPS